ncbi:hypothetical protein [Devosia sp.]|uniref:hypothetical protein n=1 Tax=Devosia sp. TaxID=1871048 RepID=UPI00273615FC|nr:hypothetical protein [Devosia sp.]MDP2782726.1 hypothetical protein [Devosia sp.]
MYGLRLLICEDEYLLASDLATELGERGATVVGIVASIAETLKAMDDPSMNANAAVLDVRLLDGMTFDLVAPTRAKGMAAVFCTGYGADGLPPEFAHLPSVGKPTDIDELLAVLGKAVLLTQRWECGTNG